MKETAVDARAADLQALCRTAATLQGRWPLAGMARLSESFHAASDASAQWQARAGLRALPGGGNEPWLELHGQADVPLQCQRCLQAMTARLVVDRRFRFARDEDEAAALDEDSEDDVLALPPRLDLHALLEDELILALPIVPRHEVCPEPLANPADGADEPADRPFAALEALRRRPGGG